MPQRLKLRGIGSCNGAAKAAPLQITSWLKRPLQITSKLLPFESLLCVQRDDAFDGAAADGAELVVAGEHDAVFFRAVIAFGFIDSSLEGTDFAGIPVVVEQVVFMLLFFLEERVHNGFGLVLLADLAAA